MGKPYEQMDDLGGNPPIFGSTPKNNVNRPGGARMTHEGLMRGLLTTMISLNEQALMPRPETNMFAPENQWLLQMNDSFLGWSIISGVNC